MNTEFHYWVTGVLAHKAGFSDDQVTTIAYCSQYVDDNDQLLDIYQDEYAPNPCYHNRISQTMNILLPRKDLFDIYPLFHFIPGDQAAAVPRADGKIHILNTTPDSSNAKMIMDCAVKVFQSGDRSGIFRLGIAAHAFVDTWAHQNFAGCEDDFNGFANVPLPNVGHADAIHHPDWVAHRWNDVRLVESQIDNNRRFFGASKRLFEVFKAALGHPTHDEEWKSIQDDLLVPIWGTTYSGDSERGLHDRVERYKQVVPWLPDYDDSELQNSSLETKYVPVQGQDNFVDKWMWKSGVDHSSTKWYQFQEAIKAHIVDARAILKDIFAVAKIS